MMKKTILLLVAALCGVLTAAAQDLIVKTDATKVEAKVTEITPDAVRYKRFSSPDGPVGVPTRSQPNPGRRWVEWPSASWVMRVRSAPFVEL